MQGGGIRSNLSEIIFLLKIVRSGWTKPTELPRQPLLSWRWPRICWFNNNNNQEWGHWAAQRAWDGAQNWGWCQPATEGRTSGNGDSICQAGIAKKWCYWQLIGLEPWGTVDCHLLHRMKAFGGYWGAKKVRGEMKWKSISATQDDGTPVCLCAWPYTSSFVFPFFSGILPLATNTNSQKCFHCLISDCSLWTEIGTLATQQHLLPFSRELSVVAQGLVTGCTCRVCVPRHDMWSLDQICVFSHVVSMT